MPMSAIVKQVGAAGRNLWEMIPEDSQDRPVVRTVNRWIYRNSTRRQSRNIEAQSTWFLRNRTLLETITELILEDAPANVLRVTSVGCSTGAEIYSLLWMLRKRQPKMSISAIGVDRLETVLTKAQVGIFAADDHELKNSPREILDEMFDPIGENWKIKESIAEGTCWVAVDARDEEFARRFGQQDVVLANNMMIHMNDHEARITLMHLARIVRPGGLIVCQGVDLDVREKTVRELRLEPVTQRIEAIHNSEGNEEARSKWPWAYWSLEPLDKTRKNWVGRYASIFRVPDGPRIN
jgi:chemotaxis methyl-accepting protein methylase